MFLPPKKVAFAVLIFSFLIASPQFSHSQEQAAIQIGNFAKVNENYYRGGQPYALDCIALKKLGVKTVIDLQKDGNFQESAWVQNAGMQYFKIPLSTSHPATADQTSYFLKLVNDPANWPVYVHCAAGRHRTGEMTAIYRITHDSWSADQAFQEMKKYGFYSFPRQGSLKRYVYQYYIEYTKPHETVAVPHAVSIPSGVSAN